MAAELLLDTGALVSLLDRSQRHHAACVEAFEAWEGEVVSTEAVLTESTHLLGRVPAGPLACLEFFLAGGATLVPASPASLERCRQLVKSYRDLPMDYADASLVALAEDLDARSVLTTDGDFAIYRIHGRKRFVMLPDIGRRTSRRKGRR